MNIDEGTKRARHARNQRNYRARLNADFERICQAENIISSIIGCPPPPEKRFSFSDPAWQDFHLARQVDDAIMNAAELFYELDPAEGERFGKWLLQRVGNDFIAFMEQMNQWFHSSLDEATLSENDLEIIADFRTQLPRIRRAAEARIRDGILPPLLDRRLVA